MKIPKELFAKKYKLSFDELYSRELPEPEIEVGEHIVAITNCKVKEYYGIYEGAKKFTLTFKIKAGLFIEKDYFVNNGIANELASLAGEVFTEYEGDELNVRDFVGKSLHAIVTYYYDNECNIRYNISNYRGINE